MTTMNPTPNHPGDPDYVVRAKLHGQRPGHAGGPYVRTIIGDVAVSASFDGDIVALAINDHECPADNRLTGVLMSLTAEEAMMLAGELELAAHIADPNLGHRVVGGAPYAESEPF